MGTPAKVAVERMLSAMIVPFAMAANIGGPRRGGCRFPCD
jgi:hypothetical protein